MLLSSISPFFQTDTLKKTKNKTKLPYIPQPIHYSGFPGDTRKCMIFYRVWDFLK